MATGTWWCGGISNKYDSTYPSELIDVISEAEFKAGIDQINFITSNYWPCTFCYSFGFIFGLCTLGLSFGCTYICIDQVNEQLDFVINSLNQNPSFSKNGIKWKYRQNCLTSWIEVSYSKTIELEEIKAEIVENP